MDTNNTNTNFGRTTQNRDKSDLQQDFQNVKDSLTQTASHAKDRAADLLRDAQNKTADIQENIVTYVKENPVKAIGISILAGFIAALLVSK